MKLRKGAILLPKGPECGLCLYNVIKFHSRGLAEDEWVGKILLVELGFPALAGARMDPGGSATRRVTQAFL